MPSDQCEFHRYEFRERVLVSRPMPSLGLPWVLHRLRRPFSKFSPAPDTIALVSFSLILVIEIADPMWIGL